MQQDLGDLVGWFVLLFLAVCTGVSTDVRPGVLFCALLVSTYNLRGVLLFFQKREAWARLRHQFGFKPNSEVVMSELIKIREEKKSITEMRLVVALELLNAREREIEGDAKFLGLID